MRRSILGLLSLLPLYGCATAYEGVYRTDCRLTKNELHIRAQKIAGEIFREVNVEPKMEYNPSGGVSIQIDVPHKAEVGVTVPPRVRLFESDDGLVAVVDTDGDGTRPEAQKLRDVVQEVLTRNNCAPWKFEEHRYDPVKY